MSDARVPRIPAALSAPSLNRGVGFTHAQRRRLGLTGRLPSAVLTLDQQAERVWHQLQSLATELGRNLLLEQLHYRHEVLYFAVLADHLPELMPVVYTPTVGEAIQRFSDEYRGQRGLFLSIDEPDEIEEAFNTLGLGPEDVDLIVCTDAEAILGIGDWGVGGIQIAVGNWPSTPPAAASIRAAASRCLWMSAPTMSSCWPIRSIWAIATPGGAVGNTTSSSVAISKRLNGYFRVPFCISRTSGRRTRGRS